MPKMVNFGEFLKTWSLRSAGQTVLPDRSIWIRQKLVENATIEWDIFGDFQTLCLGSIIVHGAIMDETNPRNKNSSNFSLIDLFL